MKKIVSFLLLVFILSCSKREACDCGTVTDESYIRGDAYFLQLNCQGENGTGRIDVLVSESVYYSNLPKTLFIPIPVCVEDLKELSELNP
jgi:hypothetical protein